MAINVVTPFSRPKNIPALVDHLRPFGIRWIPLIHEPSEFPDLNWIHPRMIVPDPDWMDTGTACYSKMNKFIEGGLFNDDAYAVLCDDDLYSSDFFDMLRPLKSEVVIVSMRLPDGKELTAAPQNCRPSRVGFEQLLVSGRIMSKYRYSNQAQADGSFIQQIVNDNRDIVRYEPTAKILWNALQK